MTPKSGKNNGTSPAPGRSGSFLRRAAGALGLFLAVTAAIPATRAHASPSEAKIAYNYTQTAPVYKTWDGNNWTTKSPAARSRFDSRGMRDNSAKYFQSAAGSRPAMAGGGAGMGGLPRTVDEVTRTPTA